MKRSQKLKSTGGGGGGKGEGGEYNTVSHLCFFATLNKDKKSSYLQLCRRLNDKMLVSGFFIFQEYTHSKNKNDGKKTNMSNYCIFR